MKWIFFERKKPTIFGWKVGMTFSKCSIPKDAKLIDFTFEGTEAEAVEQVKYLEENGYCLLKKSKK